LTDGNDASLALAAANVAANAKAGLCTAGRAADAPRGSPLVSVEKCVWAAALPVAVKAAGPFDLVLASDVSYSADSRGPLLDCIKSLLLLAERGDAAPAGPAAEAAAGPATAGGGGSRQRRPGEDEAAKGRRRGAMAALVATRLGQAAGARALAAAAKADSQGAYDRSSEFLLGDAAPALRPLPRCRALLSHGLRPGTTEENDRSGEKGVEALEAAAAKRGLRVDKVGVGKGNANPASCVDTKGTVGMCVCECECLCVGV
jgi:hypothetical protein